MFFQIFLLIFCNQKILMKFIWLCDRIFFGIESSGRMYTHKCLQDFPACAKEEVNVWIQHIIFQFAAANLWEFQKVLLNIRKSEKKKRLTDILKWSRCRFWCSTWSADNNRKSRLGLNLRQTAFCVWLQSCGIYIHTITSVWQYQFIKEACQIWHSRANNQQSE